MTVSDLTGMGSALEKLIEVIARGIGVLYEPTHIRRLAKARADEIKLLAEKMAEIRHLPVKVDIGPEGTSIAKAEVGEAGEFDEGAAAERAFARLAYQEAKGQLNIERVIGEAAKQLEGKEASQDSVDADWISRFFDTVEGVSTEEMQFVWGKVLAGEVEKPGTYSMRTLDALRVLTSSEAEMFARFCNFSIKTGSNVFVLREKDFLEEKGLPFSRILSLVDVGLVSPGMSLQYTMGSDGTSSSWFVYGDSLVLVDRQKGAPKLSLDVWKATHIGSELRSVVEVNPDADYLRLLIAKLKKPKTRVSFGKAEKVKEGYQYRDTEMEVVHDGFE